MREGWEYKKIGEIAKFSQGIQVGLKHHETLPKEGFVRFIRIVDYTQNTDDIRYVKNPGEKYFVDEDDIVMVRYGSPGLIGRGKAGVIANNLFKITITQNDITNDYLTKYLSQSHIQKFLSSQGSATMPALNFTQLKTVDVIYPKSLTEQQQIVAILDKAFTAIDTAKANIEKNIENAKELFQSKLNQIFSQTGDGWEETTLGEVCEKTKNIRWQDHINKEFKYVDLSSLSRETLNITETTTINKDNAPSRAKKIILENDVIFATTRPTLKRATIINPNLNGHLCSTGYVVLRPKENISSNWLFFYLLTSTFMDRMKTLQRGASYPAVSDNDVKGSILSIPVSKKIEENNVSIMKELRTNTNDLILQYKQKLTGLDELKKSILQKAFSGELTSTSSVTSKNQVTV